MSYLYTIRHCESLGNQSLSLIKGLDDSEIELSELGKNHAIDVGLNLKNILIKDNISNIFIFVSPFIRTLQTCDILKKQLIDLFTINIYEEIDLSERSMGYFHGLTESEQKERYPLEFNKYKSVFNSCGRYWAQYPEGESPFMVESRVTKVLNNARALATENSAIVFITHSVIIRVIKRNLFNIPYKEYHNMKGPSNGEINKFHII